MPDNLQDELEFVMVSMNSIDHLLCPEWQSSDEDSLYEGPGHARQGGAQEVHQSPNLILRSNQNMSGHCYKTRLGSQ